jgi:hypothetical protein
MREMGCEPYSGEQNAEVAGRWIRKVEKTMIQIKIPQYLRVDCATQLLSDGAMTWWETVQLRRATETLSWDDFKIEFENQYYSKYHRKMKEHEFLALRQEGMSILEYERQFHDLSLFAPHYVPSEQHMIEKLRDGFRQELKQGLIALQFKTVRELIEAAQALEACMEEGQQSHGGAGKQKDMEFLDRPPLPKKGRGEQFLQIKKKGGTSTSFRQDISGRSGSGQTHSRAIVARGHNDQKEIVYPRCAQCEQRHPGSCMVSPGRCYICRGEGHKWKTCQYLGRRCHHCGEKGHFKRECPQLNTEQPHRHRQQSQSHQQSIIVNRPGRSTQSGANSNRGRPRVQNEKDQEGFSI